MRMREFIPVQTENVIVNEIVLRPSSSEESDALIGKPNTGYSDLRYVGWY